VVTQVAGSFQATGAESANPFGSRRSLGGVSGALPYLLGIAGKIFVLTSLYMVMQVGRPSLGHALIGAIAAPLLWKITQRVLVWYFASLSRVGVGCGLYHGDCGPAQSGNGGRLTPFWRKFHDYLHPWISGSTVAVIATERC
jgi:hypothetical protein